MEPVTEVVKDQEQPKPVEQGQETQTPQQPPTDDLLSRVSKFEANNDPEAKSQDNGNGFDSKELEESIANIEDPQLKAKMEGLRKNLLSGANNKFQEIATLRKEMQGFMEQSKGSNEWTPEKVQALSQDPKFIAAAQQIAGTSEDEYSSMSEGEKTQFNDMKAKIGELEKMNQKALETQQQQLRNQQHGELSTKYANYDRKEIDMITYDMLEGKIQATPEHIYKAFKHDDNVRKAYDMGRQDERNGVQDKIQSTSAEGISTNVSPEPIVPEEKETSRSFFNRIIQKNIKTAQSKS